MVWYGMVWYCMVWYGVVWYGQAFQSMEWHMVGRAEMLCVPCYTVLRAVSHAMVSHAILCCVPCKGLGVRLGVLYLSTWEASTRAPACCRAVSMS